MLSSQLPVEVLDQLRRAGLRPKEVAIGIYALAVDRMSAPHKLAAQDVVRDWRLRAEVREAHYHTAMRGELFSVVC